jgi:hypothetical protein
MDTTGSYETAWHRNRNVVFSFCQNVVQLFGKDLLKLALSNVIYTSNPARNIPRRGRDI